MHILILPSWYINSYSSLSGIFFKEQAESLVKHNNKVGLIAIQEIGIREIWKQKKLNISKKVFIENGVNTISIQYPAIPKLHKIRNKIKIVLFKNIFQEYIKENGMPDIVHLHSYISGNIAIWLKEHHNIPYVVTEHFSGFARNMISKKDLEKASKVFSSSDYNIAVSKEFVMLLTQKFNQKFHYVSNIVNIDFFSVQKRVDKSEFQFINIAFLNKNKNQAMLIKSFAKAFQHNHNVRLTIVGDGPEYDNLQALINKLKMQNQINLFGRASREEVKELLQGSDAFVLSSQYETFGVVLIEAMACGLPVVATICGGPESIIVSDKVGLLSDINEGSLAIQLKKIYENINNYDNKCIRQYVKDNFSEKAVCLKLNDIYEKVLIK